jgi:hypothetical protein
MKKILSNIRKLYFKISYKWEFFIEEMFGMGNTTNHK